jgi:hypothetical protein
MEGAVTMCPNFFLHIPLLGWELFLEVEEQPYEVIAFKTYDGYIVGLWRFTLTISFKKPEEVESINKEDHNEPDDAQWIEGGL